jgi:uncharacterized membrane protein YkvA (DUF1232 family)
MRRLSYAIFNGDIMNITPKSIYNWYSNTIANPKYRWLLILGSIIYLISPIDIAPDFIPIVGQIDDAVILTMLVTEVSKLVFNAYEKWRKPKAVPSTEKTGDKTVDVDAVSVK